MSHFKQPKVRDRKYLDSLRELPCTFCKSPPPSEPSHIRLLGMAGMGMKSADNRCLPACRGCHALIHQKGERTFYGDRLDSYILLAESLYAARPNTDLQKWLLLGSKV